MESGTSMSAPHVAGIAALVKQKFPHFTPAAIGSALSTTASLTDRKGEPIMAQRTVLNPDATQTPATPFDMGSGFVNATAALDPGLIFDIGIYVHTILNLPCDNLFCTSDPRFTALQGTDSNSSVMSFY